MKKILFALAAVLGFAFPAFADVTVTGVGEVRVEPDQGHVVVSVTSLTDSVKSSSDRTNAEVKKIISKLRFLKINDKQIQTSNITIQPKYVYQKDEQKFVGYQATNRISICVTDVERTGEVAASMMTSDDCRLDSVYFDLSDVLRQRVMSEARQEALKDAMRKASMYAEIGKVTLGKMKSLSEDQYSSPRLEGAYSARMSDAAPSSIPTSAGEMKITIRLNVVFPVTSASAMPLGR